MIHYFIQKKLLLIQDHLAFLYARKNGRLVHECSFELDCLDQSTFNKALSAEVTVLVDDASQTFLRGILPRVGYFERQKLAQNTLNAMIGTSSALGGITWRIDHSTKLHFNAYSFSQLTLLGWIEKLTHSGTALNGVYSFPFAIKTFLKKSLGKAHPKALLLVFEHNDFIDILALDSYDILLRRRLSKVDPSCKSDLSETFIYIQRSLSVPSTLWSVYDLTHSNQLNIAHLLDSSGLAYKQEPTTKQESSCSFKTTLLQWMSEHNQFGPSAHIEQLKTALLYSKIKRSMHWAFSLIGGTSAISCMVFSFFNWQANQAYEINRVRYETLLRSFDKTTTSLDLLKLARLKIDPLHDFKKLSLHPVQNLQLKHIEWNNVELLPDRDQAFMVLRGTLLTDTEVSSHLDSIKHAFLDSTVRYKSLRGQFKDTTTLFEGNWLSPLAEHKTNESAPLTKEIVIEFQR
jgi:hypothetical protein